MLAEGLWTNDQHQRWLWPTLCLAYQNLGDAQHMAGVLRVRQDDHQPSLLWRQTGIWSDRDKVKNLKQQQYRMQKGSGKKQWQQQGGRQGLLTFGVRVRWKEAHSNSKVEVKLHLHLNE
eukprot:1160533-Pelagomonas_calceolata.AAC.24